MMDLPAILQSLELVMVYWIVLGVGFVLLLFAFLLDGLFDFGDDGSVIPAVCLFMVIFGAMGIIGHFMFNLEATGSVILAAGSGTAGSLLFYLVIWKGMKSQEGTLSDRGEDLVGHTAEVSLTIRPDTVGQITYTTGSGRTSASARSADGSTITQGEVVEIVQYLGTSYLVRPFAPRAEAPDPEKESSA